MARLAVFGYASLVDPDSAARTIGRRIEALPARLRGWRRSWTQARDNLRSEKTFARADGSLPAFVLGLNIERAQNQEAEMNGVLIELTEAELDRLDLREIRYRRVDIGTEVVDVPTDLDRVVTYVARPERFAPEPPDDAVILSSYASAVESAFRRLGEDELSLYLHSTQAAPVEVVEGVLVADRIPPGNPREW